MLGIDDPAEIERIFPRKYPLGLGVIAVSPLQMVRAFATFPNQGREVEPISIRYVEDRNGRLVLEPEKELRARQMRRGDTLRIMSPQEAYVMTNVLKSTVDSGTLAWSAQTVGGFGRPVAGKTGTTQNWSDAWAIGFTPQITAAVWFGFDRGGYSLGIDLSGANSAARSWAEFMKESHQDLPPEDFARPANGLVEVNVCTTSGLLPTRYCPQTIREIFLSGTEPRNFCDYHEYQVEQKELIKENIKNAILMGDFYSSDFSLPELSDIDSLLAAPPEEKPDGSGLLEPEDSGTGPARTWNPLLD